MTVVPSACIVTCTESAFTGTPCTILPLDLACSCTNQQLLQSAVACIEAECPGDEELAREYNQQECAAFVTTTSVNDATSIAGTAISQTTAVAEGSGNGNSGSNSNSNSGNNSNTGPTQNKSSSNIGPIVGGVIGGVLVILLGILAWWYIRTHPRESKPSKRPRREPSPSPDDSRWKPSPDPSPIIYPEQDPRFRIHVTRPDPPPPEPLPYIPQVIVPERNITPEHDRRRNDEIADPPDYESIHDHPINHPILVDPNAPPTSNSGSQDEIGQFAQRHRSHISPELEAKLRAAHYRPGDDPRSVPQNVWAERYDVGPFELLRLQEVYESSLPMKKKDGGSNEKDNHGSGFAGPSWKPSA